LIASPLVRSLAGVSIAATFALPAGGQAAASARPDVRSLFPKRAEIFVDESGLSRLFLPSEVLAACQADLADLRVVDRQGREVPYLVDSGPPPDAALEERLVFRPRFLSASRQTEERESAPDVRRETYHLSLPEGAARRWDLVLESHRPRFVRRFEVRAVGRDGEELLVGEGSVFRLQDPTRESLGTSLPLLDAAYLLVTLEGEEEFFLEPTFRLEASRVLPEGEQVRFRLEIRDSRSRDGRTVVELERPRGLVPDQLTVVTTTGSFKRQFEVWDQGPGSADRPLGRATLYRLQGAAEVRRLEMPLRPARGDGLRVVIDDGDSPPLEDLAFHASLRRPALVFSLDSSGRDAAAGELLFGGARAFRPRYDLAGLLAAGERQLVGEEARVAVELRDLARLGGARLGPVGANPLWDPRPALAFAMRPGSEIATWRFEHRRPLAVPKTDEGLLRLPLDAETVARCRPDLADLRLVDAEARQWPYLLDRDGAMRRVPLAVRGPETENGTSSYALELPASPLPVAQLLLDGSAPYFDRGFELLGSRAKGGKKARLSNGRLIRRPDDPRELVVSVGGDPLDSLELRILDGDDAPLAWTSVEALVPLPELFFAAPEGDYALLFGDPQARRPRYELEGVRDLVLAVGSTAVVAGDLAENPDRGQFSRFRRGERWQQVLLWSVLVLAALVLAGITLKLARQDPTSG
jgi:hypothetical protein